MRAMVTGANGMLGSDLCVVLTGEEPAQNSSRGVLSGNWSVTALGRADLDITDAAAVSSAIAGHDVVFNCAAYTKVDDAETEETLAYAVNATGTANLAAACAKHNAKLVTISTDYVFNGNAKSPYPENLDRDPINAYGRTKAAGEELATAAHPDGTYIVRTAWLYGANGPNFAQTMLNLAAAKDTWSVVDDQLGQPTWTMDLAVQLVKLAQADSPPGIYHGTNSGEASWFEFARAVLADAGLDPERITATDSTAFVRPAARPQYSVLGHEGWATAGLTPMRDWRTALRAARQSGVFS